MLDLEDGTYDVRIITGAEQDLNTTSFTLEKGEILGGERSAAGEFVTYEETVEVTDGQLNVYFEGEWARVNGIEVVSAADYQRKFDFGSDSSPVQYGQIQIANSLVYTEALGYGLDQEVDVRDRGEPDDVRRDFVTGEDYQFKVDVRNGIYRLKIISGDNIASNRSTFKIEGTKIKDAISSGQGEFAEFETYAHVRDGQLNLGIAERVNGLEIYYVSPLLDTAELEDVLSKAKQITNDDQSYSDESFIVLKQAIENAEKLLDSAVKQEEVENAVTALTEAMKNLKEPVQVLETKELQAIITEAKSIDNVDQLYTEESFTLLSDTIEQAETVLETAIHQVEIDEAISNLQEAMNSLEETISSQIDVSVLQELLYSAKGYTNVEKVYSDTSFDILTEAIANAKALLTEAKTQQEIDQAVSMLEEAINQLEVLEEENYIIDDVRQTEKQDYIYDFQTANDYFNIKSSFIESMEKDTYLQLTNGQESVLLPKQLMSSGSEVEFFFQDVDLTLKEQHEDALSNLISFRLVVDGEEIESFGSTPVIVSFEVDSAQVSSEESLRLVYLDDAGKKEAYLKGQYDTDNHQFTSSVEHFSTYGVFEITDETVNADTDNTQEETVADNRNQGVDDQYESSSLPETATNLFNFLLIGFVLIAGGFVMIYLYRRKLQRNK
ncbi:LPXTG cell wall anchor domain-containing protein [Gracilibacillus caseinilyticus]|uniref:LPXTG cell wall anchor domain-containing protein n=1 Tax=Gracilibacillus caseinilyticus TaxID=2932256 RepID=A0ABY4F1W4_9BACI|nr:LPXTG cell wall anchor domain-containing protein [Gracilibacillus caseinilyticus]UOQ50665.1 LPXTG cell wall anchor domain-containing protein [Gracilibacillus caseinilyticus]